MPQASNIVARPAETRDSPALIDLWRRFMREERQAVPDADPDAAVGAWSDRLYGQVKREKVVVAVREDDAVGFAGFIDSADRDWIPQSIAYVVDIYVAPEARTSAVARLLFECLMVRASRDYTRVWTNTSVQNRRVQILLKRAGFTPIDDFQIPGLKDQLYFGKELRADGGSQHGG